jgi:hypothetical protein
MTEYSSPLLISLIPCLMQGEGHIIPYHQSVGRAVKQLGWEHLVLLPKNAPDHLFEQQCACLWDADLEAPGSFWAKLLRWQDVNQLARSIVRFFEQKPEFKQRPKIIFIERFIHLQLLALTLALWLMPVENLQVWLFYRRDVHNARTRGLYRGANSIIQYRLGINHVRFLTDSEPLQKALGDYFDETFIVMPIPHTDITKPETLTLTKNAEDIIAWWAGSPREEKGWEIMRHLVKEPVNLSQTITLVASQSSRLTAHPQGFNVRLIEDKLSREDYHQWLWFSDFILIPYDSQAYRERTSGVFTECVIAGKIPLVTPQTWMAQSLEKYDLRELILTWDNPQSVGDRLLSIKQDVKIQAKLAKMQRDFQSFHQETSYAQKLASLYQNLN